MPQLPKDMPMNGLRRNEAAMKLFAGIMKMCGFANVQMCK